MEGRAIEVGLDMILVSDRNLKGLKGLKAAASNEKAKDKITCAE